MLNAPTNRKRTVVGDSGPFSSDPFLPGTVYIHHITPPLFPLFSLFLNRTLPMARLTPWPYNPSTRTSHSASSERSPADNGKRRNTAPKWAARASGQSKQPAMDRFECSDPKNTIPGYRQHEWDPDPETELNDLDQHPLIYASGRF